MFDCCLTVAMEFGAVLLDGTSFHEIDSRYLDGSGLFVDGVKKILYLRNDIRNLFKVLDTVTKERGMVSVHGPPGCGKSFAVYAFMCTILDMNYVITWVHLSKGRSPSYVRFNNKSKDQGKIEWDKIKTLLNYDCQGRLHIFILDGIVKTAKYMEDVIIACNDWMTADPERCRQIAVSSMSCPVLFTADEERDYNLRRASSHSWTIEDFKDAVKNADFLKQIEPKLDAHLDDEVLKVHLKRGRETPLTIDDKLESKFYFAGGSSRSMFDLTTKQVIENVNVDVTRAPDLFPYLSGAITERSHEAVNRLLNTYVDDAGVERCKPVSTYAALAIARKLGPQLMTELRTVLKSVSRNSGLDGTLWMMWVSSKLAIEGLTVREKFGYTITWTTSVWDASPVLEFNARGPKPPIDENKSTWLKPDHWQQGGYDVVQINVRERSLRFVQITQSDSHSFKTEYFVALLNQVKIIWGIQIDHLEICFLVPSQRAQQFVVEKPSYSGLFQGYHVLGKEANISWAKSSEIDHVKICSIME